jgi:galactokinase
LGGAGGGGCCVVLHGGGNVAEFPDFVNGKVSNRRFFFAGGFGGVKFD